MEDSSMLIQKPNYAKFTQKDHESVKVIIAPRLEDYCVEYKKKKTELKKFVHNRIMHTLKSETFADQPNREIIVFRGNKLSRIEAFRKICGNKLSREKKK